MNELLGHEGITLGGSFAAWVLFLLFTMAFLGFRSADERRALFGLAVGAYVLKTILAVVYFYVLVQEGFNGFSGIDPVNYHRWAIEMARDIQSGHRFSVAWTSTDPGYSYICSYLYTLFGNNTFVPRFLNCAIASAGVIYVYRIANYFFGAATARLATLLYLFLPFSLLLTIAQRKDAIVTFLALGLLWHTIRLAQIPGKNGKIWVIALLQLFFMHYMRSAFIWPFFGILILTFSVFSRNILTSIGGILLAVTIIAGAQVLLPEDNPNTFQHSAERFEGKLQEAEQLAHREVGLLRFARVTSVLTLWKAPLSAIAVLITPFPPLFTLQHLPGFLASWANLFVVALLPALFWGTYLVIRRGAWRKHFILLAYPLVFVALIGILHPDVTRYRETAFPAVLILMARGTKAGVPAIILVPVYAALSLLAAVVYLNRAGQL